MDILFIKLGALGDVINTLPLAVTLKKQMNARIHWLVAPLSLPLVADHPAVERVIVFDKKRLKTSLPKVLKQLRETRFDLALDLQRTLKSGAFCLAANAERKIGFDKARCKEMTWLYPFERIAPKDPGAHMLTQYMEFAEHLGAHENQATWDITVSGEAPDLLPDEFITLNIGATKPANRWPVERFAALANAAQERYGLPCVLTGGPEDAEMAEEITEKADAAPINLVGKTTIDELKETLNASRLVVSCDTGPMHLSVALGKEVIALFGPSTPRRTGPYKGRVIHKQLPCTPCNKKQCDAPKCMEAITPEDVLREMDGLLR